MTHDFKYPDERHERRMDAAYRKAQQLYGQKDGKVKGKGAPETNGRAKVVGMWFGRRVYV